MRFRRVLGAIRDKAGTAGVEFALIAPVLIAVLAAMTDLGIAFYQQMEVENAAQAGAQYAMTSGWNANAVANAVTSATSLSSVSAAPAPTQSCGCSDGGTIATAGCGSTCPSGATAGTYVTVNAQAQYATLFSYPGLANPMTLTAQAVVRIQ